MTHSHPHHHFASIHVHSGLGATGDGGHHGSDSTPAHAAAAHIARGAFGKEAAHHLSSKPGEATPKTFHVADVIAESSGAPKVTLIGAENGKGTHSDVRNPAAKTAKSFGLGDGTPNAEHETGNPNIVKAAFTVPMQARPGEHAVPEFSKLAQAGLVSAAVAGYGRPDTFNVASPGADAVPAIPAQHAITDLPAATRPPVVADAGVAAIPAAGTQPTDSTVPLASAPREVLQPNTSLDAPQEVSRVGDVNAPKIAIGLEDTNNPDAKKQADFVISTDGKVVQQNPNASMSPNVSVVLERDPGQLNPTEEQKAAADKLVASLSDGMKQRNPQAQIELDDHDAVVSPDVAQAKGLKPPASMSEIPEQTRQAIEQSNRFRGSGGVDNPMGSTDNMGSFGTREVARQANETDKQMAMKEALASLWNPDRDHPYETVRRSHGGDFRVGRFGFSGAQLGDWLSGLSQEEIDKLIAEGKLPKDFADPKFREKFQEFAHKLQDGKEAPTPAEMQKFLPKEVQETIAGSLTDQMRSRTGDNAGATVAGLLSGKSPKDVTQADLETPEAKQIAQAGQRFYDIANSRQYVENGRNSKDAIPVKDRTALIVDALTTLHEYNPRVEVNERNIRAVSALIDKESSWRPGIVNTWDSNAAKGTPSKGLMQTIGPTFQSYHVPGHNNIFDPKDNIMAGVNYAFHKYGSLDGTPGIASMRRGGGYRPY